MCPACGHLQTGYQWRGRGRGEAREQRAITSVMLNTAEPSTLLTLTSPCQQVVMVI